MSDYEQLARVAYQHAEANYASKGARYDVIVECYEIAEIAAELEQDNVSDEAGAKRWADRVAGISHEQELNQAWDGPESVKSSESYDPAHDPAGPAAPIACECSEHQLYQVGCDCGYEEGLAAAGDGGFQFAGEYDVPLQERWAHYAFEERNGMPYGSSF
jgi:hypothetical protein